MICSIERLKTDVLAWLGEMAREEGSLSPAFAPGPADVVAMKVEALLPEIGSSLIRHAPQCSLGSGVEVGCGASMRVMPCGLYAAEVRMPVGFLRLVSARMSGWRSAVVRTELPDSAGWNRQWSAEPGIAGCPERPAAYLDRDAGGLLLRVIGSPGPDDTLSWLRVLTVPYAGGEGTFDFPGALYPELVGGIAARLLDRV